MDQGDEGRWCRVNFLSDALGYIFTASHWTGSSGLGMRIGEHLEYTVIAVLAAVVIAVPMGLFIGHTGRGTFLVVSAVNALRALPTLGVLLLGVLLWGLGLLPPTVALLLLGVPPLLAGTYSGVANVDRTVVEAARAMGMTERQVLFGVEVPNALPLMLSGLRTATLQIVATATVAAYASLGGLGRYLIDGIKVRQFHLALVGAIMVTALALLLDAFLAFAVWLSAPGTGRLRTVAALTAGAGRVSSGGRGSRGTQFARSPTVDG
ncbi:Glycine betaine/carnitine/choline transport system permease protein OpuCB [Mycobacteroides franklinii]|uniref:Glycine betaine/carnitine/choline transport system permease protein OpuCB n=1 Tax=Mycobacteroides franklinii TaxID=948102 RepID=A0A4R8QVV0_9MYCO|nr:Glycine betaine/carnitine/choline transport system permease protein OpuCB [Mycobacteroides franklinii]TDZ48042.1 Glycine betaine/carnitine/choline transport system permease protein OpuCB [Mycobacteroides franklinii]TDZ60251.1 Glycine betaine/carnitine/choline transport system permease protein OpuCB [Mycobacteroides franklinii]TDZ65650.1 Glycine betaine/carnitine/choline transport system permease protein OpuCB [Mycobacteroides franklinii]TDZ73819.1 Glycine betaine/carnitine/choline transport 